MTARSDLIALTLVDMLAEECGNGNLRALLAERLPSVAVRQADVDAVARTMATVTLRAFGIDAHTVPVSDDPAGLAWTVAPFDDDEPAPCPATELPSDYRPFPIPDAEYGTYTDEPALCPAGWDAIEPDSDTSTDDDMFLIDDLYAGGSDLFADDVTPPYDPDQTMFYA